MFIKGLKLCGAVALGLYLGLLPFLGYMFAVHNPKCPCHSSSMIFKERWQKFSAPKKAKTRPKSPKSASRPSSPSAKRQDPPKSREALSKDKSTKPRQRPKGKSLETSKDKLPQKP